MITLTWGDVCPGGGGDYSVYEGVLGDFGSHVPLDCSTGGDTSVTFNPSGGSTYYLVVPRTVEREGSYGLKGLGIERSASASACLPQQLGGCS